MEWVPVLESGDKLGFEWSGMIKKSVPQSSVWEILNHFLFHIPFVYWRGSDEGGMDMRGSAAYEPYRKSIPWFNEFTNHMLSLRSYQWITATQVTTNKGEETSISHKTSQKWNSNDTSPDKITIPICFCNYLYLCLSTYLSIYKHTENLQNCLSHDCQFHLLVSSS